MTLPKTPLLAGLLAVASLAHADPVFRGPPVHDGAWTVTAAWSDMAAGPGDPTRGSYAYAYQAWALARAAEHQAAGTKLDCADLSINMLCEFAAEHGLPVEWRVYYPPEKRFVTFTSSDRQFASPAAFTAWSQHFLGAMNLADNTYPIDYATWASGDMVLMDWNQTDVAPNFEGRTVWHTYLVGVPDERIYYGNMDDNLPLPVTSTTSPATLERVREHPDRYGESPRRFRLFRGQVIAPAAAPAVVASATVIRATRLNLRRGPGTDHPVVTRALRGEVFAVVGREGRWVEIALEDGSRVWGHGFYLRVVELPTEVIDPDPDAGLQGAPTGIADTLSSLGA